MSVKFWVLCGSLVFATSALASDNAKPREAHAAGFRYLVFETVGAKPDAALPMIVGLHYSGAKAEAMLEYFDSIDFPARIVLPEGGYPRASGRSWFLDDYGKSSGADQDKLTFGVEEGLSTFVAAATRSYPTRGKPVVAGISYGGDLALLLALRHPEQFRASFPIAARFLSSWMPASNVCKPHCPPIRAMHGDADETVSMAPMREAIERLKKMGFDAEFTSYPGVAHDFDAEMERTFIERTRRLLGVDR
jgi:phospholipase/carboxylesterase